MIRAVVLTVLVTNLLDSPFPVLMAVFARQEYGSAADLGLIYGAFGGAALAGSLASSAIGHRLPRRRTFVTCFAVFPAMHLTLSTLPPLGVALILAVVFGFAAGPISPLLATI